MPIARDHSFISISSPSPRPRDRILLSFFFPRVLFFFAFSPLAVTAAAHRFVLHARCLSAARHMPNNGVTIYLLFSSSSNPHPLLPYRYRSVPTSKVNDRKNVARGNMFIYNMYCARRACTYVVRLYCSVIHLYILIILLLFPSFFFFSFFF